MVIECVQDEVKVWVNGDLVNHGTKCTATKGQIALQAEGSEVEFRKLDADADYETDRVTAHEHMIVQRKDGSLWMLAQTAKGLKQTTSTDGGRTWAEPSNSAMTAG